jgi:hypothetical protein
MAYHRPRGRALLQNSAVPTRAMDLLLADDNVGSDCEFDAVVPCGRKLDSKFWISPVHIPVG